jgi:hypothetical protein
MAKRWAALTLGLVVLVGSTAWPEGGKNPSPLDEPLRLIAQARQSWEHVKDYSCLLIKRERVGGNLGPDHVIQMRFRKEPFSVHLRWLEPKSQSGQEAVYVAGRHDNKLRVKGSGALGLFGFITIDPDDERVKASSRHSIREAGIGNLIERYGQRWEQERRGGLTEVKIADYEYNKRRCSRVETIHPTNPDGRFLYYRSVVYFDREHKLPIRMECYDWPTEPGDTRGPVAEICSFAHLKLNVGLEDEVFDK